MGAEVPVDSTVARKLREAGAIILGKANMSQWAGYRSNNGSNGWSAHGGQTYGAYYPKQDPCGSSSGSGVVSSIGLSFASIGTEVSLVLNFEARLTHFLKRLMALLYALPARTI
jgi:amidase